MLGNYAKALEFLDEGIIALKDSVLDKDHPDFHSNECGAKISTRKFNKAIALLF